MLGCIISNLNIRSSVISVSGSKDHFWPSAISRLSADCTGALFVIRGPRDGYSPS